MKNKEEEKLNPAIDVINAMSLLIQDHIRMKNTLTSNLRDYSKVIDYLTLAIEVIERNIIEDNY